MKQLIFGTAIIVLWAVFSVFQVDNNIYLRQLEELKYQADECSNTASLYYLKNEFANGAKVFDTVNANLALKNILCSNVNLDTNWIPMANSYWTTKFDVTIYYFDDSGMMKTYKNDTLNNQIVFAYNTLFTEPTTGYQKLINEPTVIVTINAGKPRFRLPFLMPPDTIRTSAYEYLTR